MRPNDKFDFIDGPATAIGRPRYHAGHGEAGEGSARTLRGRSCRAGTRENPHHLCAFEEFVVAPFDNSVPGPPGAFWEKGRLVVKAGA